MARPEIQIKARNLQTLKRALDAIQTDDPDTAVSIQHNSERVSSAIRSVGYCFDNVEGYEDYRNEMIELHKKFARVHSDGTLIRYNSDGEEDPNGTVFSVDTSSKAYNEELSALQERYSDIIEAQKEAIDHFENVTLEQRITLQLDPIPQKEIDELDQDLQEALFPIVKEHVN